jgi:hypothetical protein
MKALQKQSVQILLIVIGLAAVFAGIVVFAYNKVGLNDMI